MVDPEMYSKIKEVNPRIITVVDNSWIGPAFNPMKYEADIFVESTSKCLSGGAIISGIIVTKCNEIFDICRSHITANGLHVSPFDSWYLSQMIDATSYRLHAASKKCLHIIKEVEREAFIDCIHPSLENHPSYEMVKKYMDIFPNVAWIHITGISKEKIREYLLQSAIYIAPSYGKSHTMVDPGMKDGRTSNDTYIRLSVGYLDDEMVSIKTLCDLK